MVTTALWIAATQDQVDCLKELIAAEADTNKEDNDGQTALWISAGEDLLIVVNQDQDECLKELIAAGANINKEENNG